MKIRNGIIGKNYQLCHFLCKTPIKLKQKTTIKSLFFLTIMYCCYKIKKKITNKKLVHIS